MADGILAIFNCAHYSLYIFIEQLILHLQEVRISSPALVIYLPRSSVKSQQLANRSGVVADPFSYLTC